MTGSELELLALQLQAGNEAFSAPYNQARQVLAQNMAGRVTLEAFNQDTDDRARNYNIVYELMDTLPKPNYQGAFAVHSQDEIARIRSSTLVTPERLTQPGGPEWFDGASPYVIGYKIENPNPKNRGLVGAALLCRPDIYGHGKNEPKRTNQQVAVLRVPHYEFQGLEATMRRAQFEPVADETLARTYDRDKRQFVGRFGTSINWGPADPVKFKGDPENLADLERHYKTNGCRFESTGTYDLSYGITSRMLVEFNVAHYISKLGSLFGVSEDMQRVALQMSQTDQSLSAVDEDW